MQEPTPLEVWENFGLSLAAARELMARARLTGARIEALVLYASAVDAFLRTLVAHSTAQREGDSRGLDLRFFHHDKSLWMNERELYKRARDSHVLTAAEFEELETLYRFRNIVIHRFVTSGVTYDDLVPRLDAYEAIYRRLQIQLEVIEQPGPDIDEGQRATIRDRIARKLGDARPPE